MLNVTCTVEDAVRILRSIPWGVEFSCEFVKRTTGEVRQMVARRDPPRTQAGATNRNAWCGRHDLSVFDLGKQAYRSVSIDRLNWFSVGETRYVVGAAKDVTRIEDAPTDGRPVMVCGCQAAHRIALGGVKSWWCATHDCGVIESAKGGDPE